jgi:hypothetical protein
MANEWNTAYPLDHLLIGDVPGETRALKASAKTQIDREHDTPVDGDATGGEHSSGSAVAYEGTSTPTNRPDGSTALANNAIDRGRAWFDDNSDPPELKRWSGSAFEQVQAKGQSAYDGTVVFNTSLTTANTWQSLDLSGEVGSNRALCYAKVQNGTAASVAWAFGLNETGTWTPHASYVGANNVNFSVVNQTDAVYVTFMTHSNGTMVHAATNNTNTITITLLCYIKI